MIDASNNPRARMRGAPTSRFVPAPIVEIPPRDPIAEWRLAAHLLNGGELTNLALEAIRSGGLVPDDLSIPDLRPLLTLALRLAERGDPVDELTLYEAAPSADERDAVQAAIGQARQHVPDANPAELIERIKSCATLRLARSWTQNLSIAAHHRDATAERIVAETEALAARLRQRVAGHVTDGTLATSSRQSSDQARPQLISLAKVTPERPAPLWPGYLWLGKITMLDGDPGLGKSTVTLDLAARASRGWAMPDGAPGIQPASVILLSAEDGAADTIRPRLDASDGDPHRVHVLEGWQRRDPVTSEIIEEGMTIPRDVPVLEDAIRQVGARLVVIDPLMAYLDGNVNSYRDQDMRCALRPLAKIAERTGACVLIVRHLTKAPGGNALYRGGGSIGIIGAARSGLIIGKDPTDPEEQRRVLAMSKSNLGPLMSSLAYRVIEAQNGAPHIEWLGICDVKPQELLAPALEAEERTLVKDSVDYLRVALADGPRAVTELLAGAPIELRGRDNRPSKPMREAARRLGIEKSRIGFGADSHVNWGVPTSVHARAAESPDSNRGPRATIGAMHIEKAPMARQGTYGDRGECVPDSLMDPRLGALLLAEAAGWPLLEVVPGERILGGADAWRTFAHNAPIERVTAALANLATVAALSIHP